MKIIGKLSSPFRSSTIEYELDSLTIDGIPYAPPAPEPVQRWEQEVSLHVDSDGLPWSRHMATGYAVPDGAKARAKLGFDAHGRVWMADERAKELAKMMRGWLTIHGQLTTMELMCEAADRLAGPEPDAT